MEGSRPKTEDVEKLRELITDISIAMLTTPESDGTLRSRPLQTLEMDEAGALWFFISTAAPSISEAAEGGWQVNLSYANPGKQDYVSVSGPARLVRDTSKMQSLWTDWAQVWFPKGVDDPDLALLCVQPEKAEYWDAPASQVRQLYALTKAMVTGDKDALGENAKLNL